MTQYATAHLKVLEPEGKEHHIHMLPSLAYAYAAFWTLDKSSIHVALHSTETSLTLWA
jgi:hypothetical protein